MPRWAHALGMRRSYVVYHSERLLLLLSRFSRVRLCAASKTAAHQASMAMGFSRQEYQSEQPFPPQGDLPSPGVKPAAPASPTLTGGFFTTKPLSLLKQFEIHRISANSAFMSQNETFKNDV